MCSLPLATVSDDIIRRDNRRALQKHDRITFEQPRISSNDVPEHTFVLGIWCCTLPEVLRTAGCGWRYAMRQEWQTDADF